MSANDPSLSGGATGASSKGGSGPSTSPTASAGAGVGAGGGSSSGVGMSGSGSMKGSAGGTKAGGVKHHRKAGAGGGGRKGEKSSAEAPMATIGPDGKVGELKRGTRIWARWKDDRVLAAEVVDCKPILDDDDNATGDYRYYIHYKDFNRRMDEWITKDKLCPAPVGSGDDEIEQEDEHGTKTKGLKRKSEDVVFFVDPPHDQEGMDEASLRDHEEVTKVKNVNYIELGRFRMDTWYFSPFPKEYIPSGGVLETMYWCEYCLKFFKHKSELLHHSRKCKLRHPPGDEIYRKEGLSMFEVDGSVAHFYCQNLCYLAKLFLDHKTLFYDVDPFLFYVLCEQDEYGYHIVGYFSKEKYSEMGFNLACILTLPSYQRKGYGRFLIQFSYELSKREERVGSPEKPLSDLGYVSYRSYWSWVLLKILKQYAGKELSVMEMSVKSSILPSDIIATLQHLRLVKYQSGDHIICVAPELVDARLAKLDGKKGPVVDPEALHWAPLQVNLKKDKWSYRSKLKRGDPDDA